MEHFMVILHNRPLLRVLALSAALALPASAMAAGGTDVNADNARAASAGGASGNGTGKSDAYKGYTPYVPSGTNGGTPQSDNDDPGSSVTGVNAQGGTDRHVTNDGMSSSTTGGY
jgi:hypothetical protein